MLGKLDSTQHECGASGLDQLLLERQILRGQLSQVQLALKSLAPGFAKLSKLFEVFPFNLLPPLFSSRLFYPATTILGYVFFKNRLSTLCRLIEESDSADAQKQVSANQAMIEEIARSGLFDLHYYLSQVPTASEYPTGPIDHYIVEGRQVNPHRLFDAGHFFSANSGVVPVEDFPPLLQYIRSTGVDAYSPHPLFDARYYMETNRDLQPDAATLNPLIHYLKQGKKEGRNPHPLFFNGYYMTLYGDAVRESQLSPLEHYLLWGCTGIFSPNELFDSDFYLQQRPELRATLSNPLLHYICAPESERACTHPFLDLEYFLKGESDKESDTPLSVAYRELLEKTKGGSACLFLIPGLVKGGAERAACNYIQYLQEKHGKENVLVLSTQYEEHTCLDWLPEATRFVDVVEISKSITWLERGLLLAAFCMATRPNVTHVVNSFNFLYALARYRHILQNATRYVVYMFGYDAYLPEGPVPISGDLIARSVSWIDVLITDNQRLAQLARQALPERNSPGRLTECCYNASRSVEELLSKDFSRKKGSKILWASRLVDTKRPDLVARIAAKMPEVQFLVYGSAETGGSKETAAWIEQFNSAGNISFRGEYDGFSSIDLSDVAAFLYTTSSDGIPIVLLEAAASALPIIAPKVGGIPELISEKTGWLVEQFDDVETYCRCIEECLKRPESAVERAGNAQLLVRERHSQAAMRERLEKLKEFF